MIIDVYDVCLRLVVSLIGIAAHGRSLTGYGQADEE
jgi:hypothetical protein